MDTFVLADNKETYLAENIPAMTRDELNSISENLLLYGSPYCYPGTNDIFIDLAHTNLSKEKFNELKDLCKEMYDGSSTGDIIDCEIGENYIILNETAAIMFLTS